MRYQFPTQTNNSRDGSIAVKGTEARIEKWVEIRYFRVFGQPSVCCLDTRFFLFGKHFKRRIVGSS